MLEPETRQEYAKRAEELAQFLMSKNVGLSMSDCFRKAWVMVFADDLLSASQYALTLLEGLSTDEFAAGGDKPARERLLRAIAPTMEYVRPFDRERVEETCKNDVREAIANSLA